MSKGGGAGKVYFVLYLAVVLELLIIIVERDEAEESLLKKQKETMRIVESILSQLQSGAGTEGINTRPQDEITIPPSGINLKEVMGAEIKPWRRYSVEVGVTDISSALEKKEGENQKEYVQRLKKLIELGNVEELEYQIFYNSSPDPNNPPLFVTDDELIKQKIDFTKWNPGQRIQGPDMSDWEFLGLRKLVLDKETTFNQLNLENLRAESINPVYPKNLMNVIGPDYSPREVSVDSVFFYSEVESTQLAQRAGSGELQKRAFIVNFQPPNKAGWYKLRFASRTNRILGVRAMQGAKEPDDATTVNIGTVQLTVKDLRKVKKELETKLEKYKLPSFVELTKTGDIDKFDAKLKEAVTLASKAEDANTVVSAIRLYGYISKLLAPGMSSNFSQNRGAIEFNVHVITPNPNIADPVITMTGYQACFDKVAPVIEFQISPYQGEGSNAIEARVIDQNGATVSRIDARPLDKIAGMSVTPPANGGRRDYYGYVNQTLSPGKYKIEIIHKLAGKSKTETADLEIFKTGLTEERKVIGRLNALAYYGYPLSVEVIPTSGGKIRPNQFRLYVYTDTESQPTPIEGLTNTDRAVKLTCKANKVFAKVTWVQPFTGTEVELLPLQTIDIKQQEPEIIANPQYDFTGTATKVKVRITGITVEKSPSGCEDKDATMKVWVDNKINKVEGLKNYDISIEPTIEDEGTGYSVLVELTGKLERGEKKVNGTFSLPIFATVTNSNGKVSEPTQFDLVVKMNWEPGQSDRPVRKQQR
jgi:hypothetical protein